MIRWKSFLFDLTARVIGRKNLRIEQEWRISLKVSFKLRINAFSILKKAFKTEKGGV